MPDYGHDLQFGVFVTPSHQNAVEVVELAQAADRAGLDLVTFQDHPYQPKFLDTLTLLSYVGARTSSIHLTANVFNLRLREPAVLARAIASLDILTGGRAELGLGAGAFGDAAAAMGTRTLSAGQSVDALEEAIDIIRALWDVGGASTATLDGRYYQIRRAARGPAPVHPAGIWLGAYKPRMLSLVGRKADGWLPSLPYLRGDALRAGNAAIDEAALAAGRDPAAIRRLLNVPAMVGPAARWVDTLAEMAIADGVSTFILMGDDVASIERYAAEVAPAVRERVAGARVRTPELVAVGAGGVVASGQHPSAAPTPSIVFGSGRLGLRPTPDDGTRLSPDVPWDESTRPHRPVTAATIAYTDQGRQVGQHLIDVHDMLRSDLTDLRAILTQVRDGALAAADARAALDGMALRQNDWTLGAFCSRYCSRVAQHHGMEDTSIFPYLARCEPELAPVIERLTDEHLVIHENLERVDAALVAQIEGGDGHVAIQAAIDGLTDALLSHLSYEETELVEPLARHGFYPGQVA
jgi:alkanesulfonate monooxygenase SsuD/methylene tetrahydromethanopterin reductase-like flavin-dependent oxidoreductase (luciferase family)